MHGIKEVQDTIVEKSAGSTSLFGKIYDIILANR